MSYLTIIYVILMYLFWAEITKTFGQDDQNLGQIDLGKMTMGWDDLIYLIWLIYNYFFFFIFQVLTGYKGLMFMHSMLAMGWHQNKLGSCLLLVLAHPWYLAQSLDHLQTNCKWKYLVNEKIWLLVQWNLVLTNLHSTKSSIEWSEFLSPAKVMIRERTLI